MTHRNQSACLSVNTAIWVQISKYLPPAIPSLPLHPNSSLFKSQAHQQRAATTSIFPRPFPLPSLMRTTPCLFHPFTDSLCPAWDLNPLHSVTFTSTDLPLLGGLNEAF